MIVDLLPSIHNYLGQGKAHHQSKLQVSSYWLSQDVSISQHDATASLRGRPTSPRSGHWKNRTTHGQHTTPMTSHSEHY
jgi:hypothetical protein